jgi:hypothetical protein
MAKSIRLSLLAVALALVLGFVLGSHNIARYQLVRLSDSEAVLVDTRMGRCWTRSSTMNSGTQWHEESPSK